MFTSSTLRESILAILQTTPKCDMDELVSECSGFSWSEIFIELDRLSRSGEVRITKHGQFGYCLEVLPSEGPRPASPRQDLSSP